MCRLSSLAAQQALQPHLNNGVVYGSQSTLFFHTVVFPIPLLHLSMVLLLTLQYIYIYIYMNGDRDLENEYIDGLHVNYK